MGIFTAIGNSPTRRDKPGSGGQPSGVLQILPSLIPGAGNPLGKGVVTMRRETGETGGVQGRVTFLTACFTDAISRRDPKIGGASVKHNGEPLGRCANAHNSIVLRLAGETTQSASRWAIAEEKAGLGTSRNAFSGVSVPFHLNFNACHRGACLSPPVLHIPDFSPAACITAQQFKSLLSKYSVELPMKSTSPLASTSVVARPAPRRDSHSHAPGAFRQLPTDVSKKSVMESHHNPPLPVSEGSDQWHKYCHVLLAFFLCN